MSPALDSRDVPADRDEKPRGWSAQSAGIAFVSLLALYVLSPAPVYWCCLRLDPAFGWTGNFFVAFYKPLSWLAENVGVVERFYTWYFRLAGIQ